MSHFDRQKTLRHKSAQAVISEMQPVSKADLPDLSDAKGIKKVRDLAEAHAGKSTGHSSAAAKELNSSIADRHHQASWAHSDAAYSYHTAADKAQSGQPEEADKNLIQAHLASSRADAMSRATPAPAAW